MYDNVIGNGRLEIILDEDGLLVKLSGSKLLELSREEVLKLLEEED